MSNREGTAGGTGFLFGNIDKRGRLDEDYMDEDAKDTIDNVGSKVVDKDRDLREITEALPQHKRTEESDDDDYDDDDDEPKSTPGAAPDATPRVDYYDEDDLIEDELDQKQRAHMAALALRKASQPPKAGGDDDDDENYDDDDADASAKPSIKPLAPPPLPLKPLTPLPSPRAKQAKSSAPDVDPRLAAEQRRLMEQARVAAATASPSVSLAADSGEEGEGEDAEEETPVHFSKIFTRPAPVLKYTPRRHRFGLVASNAQAEPPVEEDDTDVLDQEHPPDEVDPVGIVIALDAENAAKRRPEGLPEARPNLRLWRDEAMDVDEEAYASAAAPLEAIDTAAEEVSEERDFVDVESDMPLVQQMSWEDEIQWRDADDSEDEAEGWYSLNGEADLAKGDNSTDPGMTRQGGVGDDDEDDDEDEFEDPVFMNVKNPPAEKENDKGKDSDSDDDMEWEDGQESANKANDVKVASDTVIKEPVVPPEKTNGVAEPKSTETPSAPEKGASPANENAKAPTANPIVVAKVRTGQESELLVLAPNKELERGLWLEDVIWDSHSEEEADMPAHAGRNGKPSHLSMRYARLILDPNDPNMIFEHLSDDSTEKSAHPPRIADVIDGQLTKAKMNELINSSGTQVAQLLESDRFNISNDIYYASGTSNFLKVDRRSILRGLQNAPPALKCLTTKTVSTDAELLSFRRPVLTDHLPREMLITPFRRKRPKGGHAQIAGQIPKKKTELFCSEKDAYRVSLYEYALERLPCILPIPGMASRIVTYARKESAAAAAQALKNAAGTPEADTVFMAPDEPPPLHAGDLEANGKPLSVIESHAYAAPCVRQTAKTTDFLLVRNGGKMYVREIDSVVSLGVTEPKVEVMAPNSERYKKYGRERALLWALREFMKKKKEIARQHKSERRGGRDDDLSAPAEKSFIEKEAIVREFRECRTHPEAWLYKVIREFARYHNGKYTIEEEPSKGLVVREAEVLRTANPQETAAFEAMEAGWENLSDTGIQIFTHPSTQGNIIAAADRSGLEAGPAVAAFIKSRLLKSPWFKSQNIISAQKQQRKELLQVLSLARIVNDLKDGGAVMESRLMSLTAAEMNNVLTNQYRLNSKKVPADVEERRAMVREMAQRKGKGPSQDMSDYAALIRNVLKKHRAAGLGKSAANVPQGMSTTTGIFLGLPLEQQRKALEDGDVSELPTEDQDFAGDLDIAAALSATGEDAFGKRPPKDKDGNGKGGLAKRNAKKPPKPPKKAVPTKPTAPQAGTGAEGQCQMKSALASSAAIARPSNEARGPGEEQRKVFKKKVTKLKVKRKVTASDGSLTYVEQVITDPAEIEQLLQKRKNSKKKFGDRVGMSSGKAKVAIDLKMLQQGSKGGSKKKVSVGPEKKKLKKGSTKASGSSDVPNPRKGPEKGMIGKIKISTKQLRKDKEEASLKRKRSQYGDDVEYRGKKAKTSRRKRNGTVQLNNILEKVERTTRETEGYVATHTPILRIARLKDGESPPPGAIANNLAAPKGTGLDFTAPVDTKLVPTYKQIIKKPMYLNLVKQKCKRVQYQSAADFIADMELLVKNASDFNKTEDVAWVVQHAELLLEVAREQISRRADDIRSAEDMIKIEKAEARANGQSKPKASKSAKARLEPDKPIEID